MLCKGRYKWDFGICICFAKVDVNGTLYRGFARASIHMNVTICKGKYSRE